MRFTQTGRFIEAFPIETDGVVWQTMSSGSLPSTPTTPVYANAPQHAGSGNQLGAVIPLMDIMEQA
jgi:hypothetical protein